MPPRLLLQNLCQGPLHGDTGSPSLVAHDCGSVLLHEPGPPQRLFACTY
jgi:hypothetical protein